MYITNYYFYFRSGAMSRLKCVAYPIAPPFARPVPKRSVQGRCAPYFHRFALDAGSLCTVPERHPEELFCPRRVLAEHQNTVIKMESIRKRACPLRKIPSAPLTTPIQLCRP
jgi:hypothetical protein